MYCFRCHGPTAVRKIIASDGHAQLCWWCHKCRDRAEPGARNLPHANFDLDKVPLVRDYRERRTHSQGALFELPSIKPRCRKCGSLGSEEHPLQNHHWAAREFFADAHDWPQDLLCEHCHVEYHRIMRQFYARVT
jgi:hypothetical protein